MPAGNRMGPEGRGPLTGRRMGLCVGTNVSDSLFNSRFGRGFGRRFGRGFRNYNFQNPEYVSDEEVLKNEIKALKEQLSFLESKLNETPEKT